MSAFLKACRMRWVLCFSQQVICCSELNSLRIKNELLSVFVNTKTQGWRLSALWVWSGEHGGMHCECLLRNIPTPSLFSLKSSSDLRSHCLVILAEGLTLMDLQLFCSLWVWCSLFANDLTILLSTTHASSWKLSIIMSWAEIFQLHCSV